MIHTSDPVQAEAARQIQEAVNKSRNLKAQQEYWQNRAQHKISAAMKPKRFGANGTEAS